MADPKIVEVGDDKKLNATKLNAVKNALDDVKIANVVRKPEGMSANLKADKDLAADNKAIQSLARHGFYPLQMTPESEPEILSANGEIVVGMNDGVDYVLRFGNISGLTEQDDDDKDSGEAKTPSTSVNRYLLVTARVNDAHFPPPDLKSIPQSIEEVEAFKKKAPEETTPEGKDDSGQPKQEDSADPKPAEEKAAEEKPAEEKTAEEKPAEEKTAEQASGEAASDAKDDSPKETESSDNPGAEDNKESAEEPSQDAGSDEGTVEASGETDASGSGQESGSGEGQDPDAQRESDDQSQPKQDDSAAEKESVPAEKSDDAPAADAEKEAAPEPAKEEAKSDGKSNEASDAEPEDKLAEMSDEEKQELLEAEQEKITKENQRKLDQRKDQIAAARLRVRDLNARFADWYYVIPEDTYSKLRVSRTELFEDKKAEDAAKSPGLNFTPPQGGGFPIPQGGN